ncbi:MAG: hypothetical protein ABSH36_00450 [Solirubrobacteraceae bacterium]
MSAFVVSHSHIHLLVHTAMYGPTATRRTWHTFSYYHRTPNEPAGNSGTQHTIRPGDFDAADKLGQLLVSENVKSVHSRYPNDHCIPPEDYSALYRFGTPPRVSTIDVLVALDSYEYQACEHSGWRTSEAHSFTDALRRAVIGHLPGYYESNCWTIREGQQPPSTQGPRTGQRARVQG